MKTLSTGVGSLPFRDAGEALAHAFCAYDIPFYPQLASHGIIYEATPKEAAAALMRDDGDAFMRALKISPRSHLASLERWPAFIARGMGLKALKFQCCGPVTVAAVASKYLSRLPGGVHEAIWQWQEDLSKEAAEAMMAAGVKRPFVIWDEPCLSDTVLGEQGLRYSSWVASFGEGVRAGVHCCAPISLPPLLAALTGGVVSFDATLVSPFANLEVLKTHWQRGGDVIFGVGDTAATNVDQDACHTLRARLLTAFSERNQDLLISGGCGTGLRTPDFERALAKALRA